MKFIQKIRKSGKKYLSILGVKIPYGRYIVRPKRPATVSDVSAITQIYTLAASIHKEVFPKYKGVHHGQDMVLLASGPTVDYYTPLEHALHVGVNDSFRSGKAELDYLFLQDYSPLMIKTVKDYQGKNCKKFFGIHYCAGIISQDDAEEVGAERYVFFHPCWYGGVWRFAPDISVLPLSTSHTVAHCAAQFALWTRPRRLFIVGCDVTNSGHARGLQKRSNGLHIEELVDEWKEFKKYAAWLYPNTEIISVNPQNLRGIFHDVYTRSFLDEHPELADQHVEILEDYITQ